VLLTAKEAWDSIKTMCIGDDRLCKVTLQKVRSEYELLSLKEGESVEDFAMRLNNLTNQLAMLGDTELDNKIIDRYLCIGCPRYVQLVISIQTLLDSLVLSIEEITRQLKAAEDNADVGVSHGGNKLYQTEEQWLERYKQKGATGSRCGGGSGGGGRRKGGHGRKSAGSSGKSASTGGAETGSKPLMDHSKEKCHNCGKTGHWAWDCHTKGKKEQAHVTEDDESSLLLVDQKEPLVPVTPAVAPISVSAVTTPMACDMVTHQPAPMSLARILEQMEESVYAVQDATGECILRRWIFDTGTSNHMIGPETCSVLLTLAWPALSSSAMAPLFRSRAVGPSSSPIRLENNVLSVTSTILCASLPI
jgi:hypothetical protein